MKGYTMNKIIKQSIYPKTTRFGKEERKIHSGVI